METKNSIEVQELHLTLKSHEKYPLFKDLCKLLGGKSIQIEIPTDTGIELQSMSVIPLKTTRAEALRYAKGLKYMCERIGINVARVKLECSVNDPAAKYNNGYFEGHLSIMCDDANYPELRKLVSDKHALVSRNVAKEDIAMINFRRYGDKETFLSYVDDLVKTIQAKFTVTKRIHEFCYYDSNIALDKNWS